MLISRWAARAEWRWTPISVRRMGGSPAKGKAQYTKRKWLSEAANGWIKEVLGCRRFSVRGARVEAKPRLPNIKRMAALAAC